MDRMAPSALPVTVSAKDCLWLAAMQRSFFNGILRNELIHLHRVLLADAVGTVSGPILRRHCSTTGS